MNEYNFKTGDIVKAKTPWDKENKTRETLILDDIEIKYVESSINPYIEQRDNLINDKIYPDEDVLYGVKNKHDKALTKAIEELTFDMSSCAKSIADATKPILKELSEEKRKHKLVEIELKETKVELADLKNEFNKLLEELRKEILKK